MLVYAAGADTVRVQHHRCSHWSRVTLTHHLHFHHVVLVQHQLHFENVACHVLCEHNCTLPECMNSVQTNLVRVAPSKLISGEVDLFACEDIEEGTVIAGFGVVRQLREGEEVARNQIRV